MSIVLNRWDHRHGKRGFETLESIANTNPYGNKVHLVFKAHLCDVTRRLYVSGAHAFSSQTKINVLFRSQWLKRFGPGIFRNRNKRTKVNSKHKSKTVRWTVEPNRGAFILLCISLWPVWCGADLTFFIFVLYDTMLGVVVWCGFKSYGAVRFGKKVKNGRNRTAPYRTAPYQPLGLVLKALRQSHGFNCFVNTAQSGADFSAYDRAVRCGAMWIFNVCEFYGAVRCHSVKPHRKKHFRREMR